MSVRLRLLVCSHRAGQGKGRVEDIERNSGGMEIGSALGNDRRRPNQAVRSVVQQDRTLLDSQVDPAGRERRPGGGSKVTMIHRLRESGLNAVKTY